MENEIKLLKNNDNRTDSDLDWIEEFYNFLQGVVPEGITTTRGRDPKLSAKKAFTVIWYLQEHFPIFPDHIEKCWNCEQLFDTECEGLYWESKGRHYCGSCHYQVPQNYDNNQRG